MINEMIEKVIDGHDLTFDEAHQVMLKIMHGEVSNSQIAAYLIALKGKGEHDQEIAGSARAMRDMSVKLETGPGQSAIDVCGTGGDESGTFNISTAAAFVVAAAGIPVAKHGNRSVSSKSGSADVLQELGVNINLAPERSAQALKEIGITFLFAPDYHPAMKHVAPVRRELGMKTIFNILGPLTNPAGTQRQMIGTFNNEVAEKMASAAEYLDMDRICFICTDNRYDEIMLSGKTAVYEYSKMGIKKYSVSASDFGYPEVHPEKLKGDSPQNNADILRQLFSTAQKNPVYHVTVANAAMALFSAGFSDDLSECRKVAEKALLTGQANKKLQMLIEFGKA